MGVASVSLCLSVSVSLLPAECGEKRRLFCRFCAFLLISWIKAPEAVIAIAVTITIIVIRVIAIAVTITVIVIRVIVTVSSKECATREETMMRMKTTPSLLLMLWARAV